MPRRVLLVCGGNTCRSAMGEAIMRSAIDAHPHLKAWVAESAGVSAMDGMPATDNAVAAAAEIGLDISGHRSRMLTRDMLSKAHCILAMEFSHLQRILELDPDAGARACLLAESDINDPFGGGLDVYRHTRDEIHRSIWSRLGSLGMGGR